MTIECYYRWCPHHVVNTEPYSGPFCHESECKADTKQLLRYENLRKEELKILETNRILREKLDACSDS